MKRKIINQKGASLPLVLVTLLVLSIFTLTAISLSTTNFKVAKREEDRTKAYYIARTGSEIFTDYIVNKPTKKNPMKAKELNNLVGKKSQPTKFGDGEFTISIKNVPQETEESEYYKVTSVGKVNGVSETTSVIISRTEDESTVSNNIFKDRVLFSKGDMQIGELDKNEIHSFIKGLIQTNSKKIEFDKKANRNNVILDEDAGIADFESPDFTEFKKNNYSNLEFKDQGSNFKWTEYENEKHSIVTEDIDFYDIQLESDEKVVIDTRKNKQNIKIRIKDSIQAKGNSTIEIKTIEETEVNIYADNVSLQENSNLKISGGGNVNIISENIEICGELRIENINQKQNQVKIKASNNIDIKKNANLYFKNNKTVFLYTKGNIQFHSPTLVRSIGNQNVYFHGEDIQMDDIVLKAEENSKVNFFIEGNNFQLDGSSKLITDTTEDDKKTSQIFIVLAGPKNMQIGQKNSKKVPLEFHGYIYAPMSDIQVRENSILEGSFISSKIQTESGIKLDHRYPDEEDMSHLEHIIPTDNSTNSSGDASYKIQRREE